MRTKAELQVLVGHHINARQGFAEADTENLFGYSLPRVAATEEEVSQVEHTLGRSLPEDYRTFLLCCSGWPHFVQDIDLYGVAELATLGTGSVLDDLHPSALMEAGIDLQRDGVVAIGSAREDRHRIVLTTSGLTPGRVVWFAGTMVDSFAPFSDALASFTALTRESIEEFRS